jgi:NADH-quinone oxidoreductase subunit N
MNTSLTLHDFAALSPLLIVLFGALATLLMESFEFSAAKTKCFALTLVILAMAVYAQLVAPESENTLLTPWLKFDSTALVFNLLFLFIGVGTALLAAPFFHQFEASFGEFYFLLFALLFGAMLIGSAADFLTLFLGLETLSIALYILCGYMKKWEISHESSMKYFLMGALAASLLLYGIALIYGAVGTTRFDGLLSKYQQLQNPSQTALFLTGIALVTLGLAFKAAIVPLHVWAPDVYEGASNPVTAFMAIGAKAAAFAAFVRVFLSALPGFNPLWNEMMTFLAYPTLIYANFVAMRQIQLRRFFAYSGISHAGFLLIPLIVGGKEALPALLFYLTIYAFAMFGCFAVLAYLDRRKEGVMMHDLHGLFYRSPLLAGVFSISLLTLAGFPPTAGFFAKFYLLKLAFQAGYYPLVIVGILMTILSAYYYLRIISYMLTDVPGKAEIPMPSLSAMVVGGISFAGILIISCYPAPLLNLLSI